MGNLIIWVVLGGYVGLGIYFWWPGRSLIPSRLDELIHIPVRYERLRPLVTALALLFWIIVWGYEQWKEGDSDQYQGPAT